MYLSGHVNFRGPGLKKERFLAERKNAGEFILDLREGPVPEVENFDAWVQMDEDDEISIETNIEKEDIVYDDLYLEMKSKNGGTLSLTLSEKQAAALAKVLSRYAEIRAGIHELTKTVRV
jgi:hypothetical protein